MKRQIMNKRTNHKTASDTPKSRYNFKNGKRTDHAHRYQSGHEVRIERTDGSVTVQRFTLEDAPYCWSPMFARYSPIPKP